MDALQQQSAAQALEVCFQFSSDRCRAAVGGTLEAFVQYADNPVFGTLVNCESYEILSVGPIIPGSTGGLGHRRGELQTVLIEITEGLTAQKVLRQVAASPTYRTSRRRHQRAEAPPDNNNDTPTSAKRKFLWTLQRELRPPRQDCWLVHEVLFTKNAFELTE